MVILIQYLVAGDSLVALKQHQKKVIAFLNDIKIKSNYNLDKYWILLHELVPSGKEFNNYREKTGLTFLKEKNVSFIKPINEET